MGVNELVQTVRSTIATVRAGDVDEHERKVLLQACDDLRSTYETPLETSFRVLFSSHQAMALRLGVDMKLFDAIAKRSSRGDGSHFNVQQLADDTGADPALVARIIRLLAAMGVLKEVDAGLFSSTPLATAYVLPDYFKEKGWKNPADIDDGPFQFAMNTKSRYFDFLSTAPYYQEAFNKTMTLSVRWRGQSWFEFFPVEQKLRVQRPSDALLVDVGGGQDRDLVLLKERFPTLPGRLVLQDLPNVVKGARDLHPGIDVQEHDFLRDQPVKGARAYYLRAVLHDWPEKQVVQILAKIREAMAQDSLLLIDENLMPESNVPLLPAMVDLSMMVSFAAAERTKTQFESLLNEAGFELVKAWMPPGAVTEQTTLLEARVRLEA
ncbi:uncharacterized protein CDV56_108622 [Aspergillus thermomutatus]|uniref:Uncharacterized protein n=1 Tax=Aspergillus thermomutatus TaxID=41047 RepID=A0A397H8M8_ASPTH|nr:uncharacterized protein CDV56_108622 [Aspergillus thermomutatus]RHZ59421.1 hypothetical protein CDV56_108622 [Aspergillus thermomutatus]